MTRIGSLFTGTSGLDMAVQQVLGGTVAWHSDIEPASVRLLEHHYPDVPNLGDITIVDWATVEPVDVLTGGFPCQDLSMAGKRLGLRPGTRSGLWEHMAYAIDQLRPTLVVIENVRGLLSARASGDVEPCPWCVGDGSAEPLRALGAVLGDLAGLGYDAQWVGIRAADVGAPHGRFRVFITAHPRRGYELPGPEKSGGDRREDSTDRPEQSAAAATDTGGETQRLRPRLCESEPRRIGWGRPDHDSRPASADADQQGSQGAEPAGRRHLPTRGAPPDADGCTGGPAGPGPGEAENGLGRGTDGRGRVAWGTYGPAIRRWEALTRPAPPPTEPGKTGQPRLSPAFVEWMQGLPTGHVTGVPGLTRNQQLKLLGNGVVPQQAAAALHHLLGLAAA